MFFASWIVVYAVVLLLGLIAGVLARYLLALAVVVITLVVLGVAVLSAIDPGAPAVFESLLGHAVRGLPISPAAFFTVGGLVFLVGVVAGILLTSPLRGLERTRYASRS